MEIVLVAAVGRGDPRSGKSLPIGKNGKIPWLGKLPVDMKHFRRLTLGKTVVMGRKTFESIGNKPLSDRTNIVLSRDQLFHPDGIQVARTVDEAIALAGNANELMVIGGEQIYHQFLPHATRLELTAVLHDFDDADAFFPNYDPSWNVVNVVDNEPDERNAYWCRFLTYKKE